MACGSGSSLNGSPLNASPLNASVRKCLLIGAESTGKTTLGHFLEVALPGVLIEERLRTWCLEHGRTPSRDDQPAILQMQIEDELAAAGSAVRQGANWLICDSGPWMTALYSEFYFNDPSLWPSALAHTRSVDRLIWVRPGVEWQADGIQRDGALTRSLVDTLIGERLDSQGQHHFQWGVEHGENAALQQLIA
jgi:nicotinamide riboside kinase